MASFQSQYGIRVSQDLSGMKWREFAAYLSGLDGKTPLGQIVSIRAEDDPKVLKQFTKRQQEIRNRWRTRKAKAMPQEQIDAFLESMKQMFISMAGGQNGQG